MERNDYEKALFMIDMNNGFVNFGAMANRKYNDLVPEQLRMIEKFRNEGGLVNFVLEGHNSNAHEFKTYPEHCVIGTSEADLIPEFIGELKKSDTRVYYKNSINGMLNRTLQDDIRNLKRLREIVVEGVCTDLCVMDFARTLSRYLDELDKDASIFVVKNAVDTFDAPNHNREEWTNIAYKVMEQSGIVLVDNIEDLEKREKVLSKGGLL